MTIKQLMSGLLRPNPFACRRMAALHHPSAHPRALHCAECTLLQAVLPMHATPHLPPHQRTALQPCHTLCRACEEVLYGRDSVSLSTSKEVSRAGELARWIVMDSGVSAKWLSADVAGVSAADGCRCLHCPVPSMASSLACGDLASKVQTREWQQ